MRRAQKFQPTRPLRGATNIVDVLSNQVDISTHAPLAGRDNFHFSFTPFLLKFQPTRPLRGATASGPPSEILRGISTHAPLAGRDKTISGVCPRSQDFNPRAPCGARQQKCTNHYAHFCDNRQISDAFAQNAACQGILLLFDAGKPCGFWVRTTQEISARLCFAL